MSPISTNTHESTDGSGEVSAASQSDARSEQLPTSMWAVVTREYGGAEVLRSEQIPLPDAPGEGEVLLRVGAAGMDRGTWHLMSGQPRLVRPMFGLRRPRKPVPGLDVAGTVVAVGPGVQRLAVGDRVFGIAKGSYAQYALALEKKLAVAPVALTDPEAAVLGVSGLTALQALRDVGRVEPGQRILILGASGGVGSYAVQIAVALGAQATAVCSAAKAEFVRSLGADNVLDYRTTDPVDGSVQYDLIVDIGGNRSLRSLRRALTPKGSLVVVGGENGGNWTGGFGRMLRAPLMSLFVSQRLAPVTSSENADDLGVLAQMVDAGTLRPAVDSVVPLANASGAMRRLVAGEVRGKIALSVS